MSKRALPPWARWLLAVAAALVAVTSVFTVPRAESLRCTRGDGGYACVYAVEYSLQAPRRSEFGPASVGSIELREYTSGKGGRDERGATWVFDRQGQPLKLFGDARELARERHARIEAFVAGEGAPELNIERSAGATGLLMPLALLGVAVALAVSAVRARRAMATDATSSSLSSSSSSLAKPSFAASARALFGGHLRGVLLLVLAATVIAVVAQLVMRYGAGYVEVRCQHRCKIGGGECLPGGAMTMWRAPGPFEVEVYDPDAPEEWTPISIEVEAGGEHVLVCKPPGG
ncbi:MAG: hypothetical protein H6713_34265 [Myxococcales bacterium]|nr:hypothetical protein [Myxococcales bacterium]MCB9755030.1 hypothetical protein [Myxococcales bacterium]